MSLRSDVRDEWPFFYCVERLICFATFSGSLINLASDHLLSTHGSQSPFSIKELVLDLFLDPNQILIHLLTLALAGKDLRLGTLAKLAIS